MTMTVHEATQQLIEAIQADMLARLTGSIAAPKANGLAKTNGRSHNPSRPGQKRTPEELAELTDDLRIYISKNPGMRIEEIARGMGATSKALVLPATKLLAAKKIKTTGQRRATRYFPKG